MLRAISSFSSGRRSKWVVVGIWVVVAMALFQFQPKLQEATTNENEAFLPENAESTEVNDIVGDEFPDGREVDAIVLYTRGEERLTQDDFARIEEDASELCAEGELEGVLAAIGPRGPIECESATGIEQLTQLGSDPAAGESQEPPEGAPPAVSEDGTTALLLIRTNSEDSEEIQANVEAIRDVAPPAEGGQGELRSYTTGIAGIISDSIEVFESIDLVLLLVTVSLVLVLLLAIYRSPVIAFVPLIVVAFAYGIAAAAVYGLVEAGAIEVNGQTTALLIVLMFGAGTDYCLLIVSRYREELRLIEDKHEAMAHATERTAPAILSAGATVIASMLVLTLADFKATQTLGPSLALGVAVMLLAGLTFLPALLSCLGRNAFWPSIPRQGSEQKRPLNVWRRVGHFVHDHPTFAIATTVASWCSDRLAVSRTRDHRLRRRLPRSTGIRRRARSARGKAFRGPDGRDEHRRRGDCRRSRFSRRSSSSRASTQSSRPASPRMATSCASMRRSRWIRSQTRRTISFRSFARKSGAQPEARRRWSGA